MSVAFEIKKGEVPAFFSKIDEACKSLAGLPGLNMQKFLEIATLDSADEQALNFYRTLYGICEKGKIVEAAEAWAESSKTLDEIYQVSCKTYGYLPHEVIETKAIRIIREQVNPNNNMEFLREIRRKIINMFGQGPVLKEIEEIMEQHGFRRTK